MVSKVAGDIDQLFCGWWQLKQVRPLVPRDWKKERSEVVTAPAGKYVEVWPMRFTVVVVCGKVAGVLPRRMAGSTGTLSACCHAAVTHAGSVEVEEVD